MEYRNHTVEYQVVLKKTVVMKKVVLTLAMALLIASCASEESQTGSEESQTEKTEQVEEANQEEGEKQLVTKAGDPAKGEQLFKQYCSACHGQDAKGIEGVGPSLVNNEFVRAKSVEELVQFVIEGRPVNHPENKTGIPMPPRGGFEGVLTDEEIVDIVAYIKTLEGNS